MTGGIVYLGGGWESNIGNSFYNLGALHALRSSVDDRPVYFIPDIATWTWADAVEYSPIGDVDADLWVMSGPSFSKGITHYQTLFEHLRSRGKQIAFLSVGLWTYSDSEWRTVRTFLEPHLDLVRFISTRDRRTFERVRELDCASFDGICGSMFLSDIVPIPSLERPPYIVLNFPQPIEPRVELSEERKWVLTFPDAPVSSKRRSPFINGIVRRRARPDPPPSRSYQQRVNGFDIVRTQSRGFKKSAGLLFDRPDVHYSTLPSGYLTIYKNAEVVFTDRVHTAAATLVLGGTVQYCLTSQRARDGRWSLLDRVGAAEAVERPTKLDLSALETDKSNQLAFLRDVLR